VKAADLHDEDPFAQILRILAWRLDKARVKTRSGFALFGYCIQNSLDKEALGC